jgi:uncharacterized membrane protein
MSHKTFMLLRLVVVIIVAILAAWAVSSGNVLILIPAVIVGAAVMFLLSKRVREVVVDERVYSIADKASRLTVKVFVALMVITAAALITISRGGSPEFEQAGFTMAYATCGLLLIYWIAYIYYNRKLGGK